MSPQLHFVKGTTKKDNILSKAIPMIELEVEIPEILVFVLREAKWLLLYIQKYLREVNFAFRNHQDAK